MAVSALSVSAFSVSAFSMSAVLFTLVVTVFLAVIVVFLLFIMLAIFSRPSFHIDPAVVFDIVGTARVNLDEYARGRRQEATDVDIYIGRLGRIEA